MVEMSGRMRAPNFTPDSCTRQPAARHRPSRCGAAAGRAEDRLVGDCNVMRDLRFSCHEGFFRSGARGEIRVHRSFGCTPRITGNRTNSPRATPCPVRRPYGAHQASLRTSGTADGWKRGRGPSAFFLGWQNQLGCSSRSPEANPVCDGEALSPAVFAARSSRLAATPPPNCGGGVVLRSLLLSWIFSGTPLSSTASRTLPSGFT
jgi:hypothetical protein